MTIGVMHVRITQDVHASAAIDRACLDQCVFGFAPIGAAIHAQRAADCAGNAAHERQTANACFLRCTRDLDVRHGGAGANPRAFHGNAAKAASQPHDRAADAAVAHDQVRSNTNHGDGKLAR